MGKTILICSGKGGSGKTTFASNLGAVLSKRGAKVLILDMNVGLRNSDIYLGMENSILFDLGDVFSGMCNAQKAIIRHDLCDNLFLLSCPQYREIDGISASHMRTLYARLKKDFDFVLVDCPVTSGLSLVNLSSGADLAIIVTTQDFSSLRNCDAVNRKLAAQGIFSRFHVINMVFEDSYNSEDLPDLLSISRSLESECIGMIPFNQKVHLSNNRGVPIVLEDEYFAKKFSEIADKIK